MLTLRLLLADSSLVTTGCFRPQAEIAGKLDRMLRDVQGHASSRSRVQSIKFPWAINT